jgi:hypothetical protein
MSVDRFEFVLENIVSDVTIKPSGVAIMHTGYVDATTEELVDEGTIMIGTHTCPAFVIDFVIE